MDQALKAAWTAALRSGEYRQCSSQLHSSSGGYCCLGVLAKIANLTISADGCEIQTEDEEHAGYRPIEALVGQSLNPFWERNDGNEWQVKHTFPQIADYIYEVL